VPDVLIIADTIRSPELRHEVPLAVPDAFFYAEVGGKRSVVVSSLESGRIDELGVGLDVLTFEDAGIDELLKRGLDSYALDQELYLGACKQLGLEAAITPAGFPLGQADHLRANGIELTADQRFFDERRRVIVPLLNQLPGFRCQDPGGAFYVFPNISGTGMNARELQTRMLEQAGVATVAGTSFGIHGEGFIRFSYANSVENIREAVKRLAALLRD